MNPVKTFKQPSGQPSIYDSTTPQTVPDTSTSLKKALVEFENRVRGDRLESGAFFAIDGRLIAQAQGLADQVSFTNLPLYQVAGRVFTHNHPGGGNFSQADVQNAIAYNLAELRVVTQNMRFSLKPGPLGWPTEPALAAAVNQAGPSAQRAGLQAAQDGLNTAHLAREIDHQLWHQVAKKFTLTYTREKS